MKTWTRVLIAAAIASLVPALALAQVQPPAETLTAADIYREVFGVDPSSLAAMLSGNAPPTVIATVSRVVNVAALTAAVFIVVMTFLVGVAQTAHEGNVMGRRYNSMWVQVRTVFGLGLLAPLPGGYSAIQILVLWLGFVGSNLAEQAWENSLDFVQTQSTFTTVASTPAVRDTVASMLAAQVCTARANTVSAQGGAAGPVEVQGRFVSEEVGGVFTAQWTGGVSFDATSGGVNGRGACGSFLVTREMNGQATLVGGRAQASGLMVLAGLTRPLAQEIAAGNPSADSVRSRLRQIEAQYTAIERQRAQLYLAAANGSVASVRERQLQMATEAGWLLAGAWYMTMAGLNASVQEELGHGVAFTEPRLEQFPESLQADVAPYVERVTSITRPGIADTANGSGQAPGGEGGFIDYISGKISEVASGIFFDLVDALAGGGDPIVDLANIGHEGLNLLAVAVTGAAGAAVFGGVAGVMLALAVFSALGAIGIALAALAYYLPLVPFLLWMMGVAAWVVMLIEKIVVAPLWAAAHTLPEGDGFAGQHARQGYMILIGLVARPVLMIAGFVAAMLMVTVVAKIVGIGFKYFVSAASVDRQFGLFALVAYSALFVGAVLVFTRFAFSLITLIPDRVLRWLGGGVESLGQADADSRVGNLGRNIALTAGGAAAGALKMLALKPGRSPPPRDPAVRVSP